jgi:two-component system chemotaxis response regulator CheY
MTKVLIGDDSHTIRRQVTLALIGFVVLEATDGVEALEVVANEREIALILLDVNMPRLGGLEVLDRLHADPISSRVPVLMLTTEVERTLVARAKAAGAKGWLIKPVKPELLLAAVSRFVRAQQ